MNSIYAQLNVCVRFSSGVKYRNARLNSAKESRHVERLGEDARNISLSFILNLKNVIVEVERSSNRLLNGKVTFLFNHPHNTSEKEK